jgi:hypothetical protein
MQAKQVIIKAQGAVLKMEIEKKARSVVGFAVGGPMPAAAVRGGIAEVASRLRVQLTRNPMADNPVTPPAAPPPGPPPKSQTDFQIGEEFGTARRTLPPAGIVLMCIAAVAIILGALAYFNRQKPQAAGSIDSVMAVEVPGQNATMVAVTLTLHNKGERSFWVHTLKARLTDADGKTFDDEAASGVDFDRYFQAFPVLKENTQPPLSPETKLAPGAEQRGTIIVSFPVTKDAFDKRKSISVTIQPYDQPLSVVLTK